MIEPMPTNRSATEGDSTSGTGHVSERRRRLLDPDPVKQGKKRGRGRVVMLVDNAVVGDSRVQKQARSMADRGWNVVLLGRRRPAVRGRVPQRWRLGDARVRLLRFPGDMSRRRLELRRGWLRRPLAYPSMSFARHRHTEAIGHLSERRFRSARLKVAPGAGARLRRPFARAAVLWSRRVVLPWVEWRYERTRSLHESRRSMSGWVDRLSTAWWEWILGQDAWRVLDPELLEFEAVYGPVLDRMRPDIIHANDFRMLGVGARAAVRARAEGRDVKLVWDAHEFLPGIKPWSDHPRWHRAQILHERAHAGFADAVVTVTEPLADLLVREHDLPTRPAVVLNAPSGDAPDGRDEVVDVRRRCGLDPSVPLLVYAGAAAPQRGLDVMIEALPALPDVHVALVVADPPNSYVRGLISRARELDVKSRLHVLGYVPVEDIVPFLSGATIGVIPIHHNANHHISLATKFFEYSHARLPILVSDVRAMSDMVTRTGQGEVFTAEDVADYARVASKMLENIDQYRAAYTDELLADWTWERQAEVLDRVYAGVLGAKPPHRA